MDVHTIATASVSIPPVPSSPSSSPSGSPKRRPTTCPFAVLAPTATPPPGHPQVELPQRRCPRWVRVLRFSAKLIAKQVVIRTVKKIVKDLIHAGKQNTVPLLQNEQRKD